MSQNQIFITDSFGKIQPLKNDFETKNFEIFDKAVHNFGKSEDVII